MGRVALEHVSKRFDDVAAVDDLTLDVADEEFLVLLGPSGCGKSTALRDDRRPRGPDRGHHHHRRARRQRRRGQGPRHRDGVPELRALPAHDGAEEHRVPAAVAQGAVDRERDQLVRDAAESLDLGDAPRPQARAAVGRSTPAGRAGARDRAPPAGVPHGRAALEPRRQAAGADPRRARRAAAAAGGDDHLRHPRPGRGDDDGPPHRDPRRTACCSRSARRRTSTPAGQPVRRPLHRQPAHEHGRPAPSTASTACWSRSCPAGTVAARPELATAVEASWARRGGGRRAARGPAFRRHRRRSRRPVQRGRVARATNATSCAGSSISSS